MRYNIIYHPSYGFKSKPDFEKYTAAILIWEAVFYASNPCHGKYKK